jgi:hypothetical protein
VRPLDEILTDCARSFDVAVEATADRQKLLRESQRLNPCARTGGWDDA